MLPVDPAWGVYANEPGIDGESLDPEVSVFLAGQGVVVAAKVAPQAGADERE